MTPTFKPQSVPELADYVALGGKLEIMGSGTKRGLGRPLQAGNGHRHVGLHRHFAL